MKNQKIRTGVVAAALTIVVAIGGTFAYMSATTNAVTNQFVGHGALTGELTEPAWEETGKADAENYRPCQEIAKDPRVKNTSDLPEWMAIKVSNLNAAGEVLEEIKINDGWSLIDTAADGDYKLYMYVGDQSEEGGIVPTQNYAGQTATDEDGVALFDQVTIRNIEGGEELSAFDLNVVGYAVQGDISYENAKTELSKLAAK